MVKPELETAQALANAYQKQCKRRRACDCERPQNASYSAQRHCLETRYPMPDTDLCTCGSGLRQIRCCTQDLAALPLAAGLELLNPIAADATRLFNEKKLVEAEALVLKLLDLAPNHRLAIRILFELRKAGNHHRATEILARRLAGLPTDHGAQAMAANLMLAQWLIGQGRHAEAVAPARIAVKNGPRDVTAHHVMGVAFTEAGQTRQGERHYRKAWMLHGGDDGTMLGNLAWNLKLQGRLQEAAELYQRALTVLPENRRAIGGYAQTQAARGDTAHAARLLDTALDQPQPDRSLRLLRALLDLPLDQPDAVLTRLNDPPAALLPAELIARGQAYLRLAQPERAIPAFADARRLQQERFGQRYDASAYAKKFTAMRGFFTADRLAALPAIAPALAPQPIFLLGFPGSGTALLEQLLAKLPGFAAADDHNPVASLLEHPALANYPDCLTEFAIGDGEQRLTELRAQYQKNLTPVNVTEQYQFITSRAAGDAWHLGLIRLLFPDAPILHLLRHPLDIAAVNFARDKKLEANCAVSLPAVAQHYALTMSMIQHYRGQLTLRYLPIRYEALVEDPATSLRQITEFIGAKVAIPDAAELQANRNIASAGRTPAHAVAQAPIHSRGIGCFRAFEAASPGLFSEIRPILAPWITELGYAP